MAHTRKFTSLVDMQEWSCAEHGPLEFIGTKVNGHYQWTTFAQFAETVDHFRGALARLGVKQGDKVAVIANNCLPWAIGAYSSYGRGAHYVPMYEAQQPKEWEYILRDCGAKVLLVSNEDIYDRVVGLVDSVPSLERVICFQAPASVEHSWARQIQLGADHPVSAIHPRLDDVASLIYTSGTTGLPKGVVLSHGNLVSNINAVQELLPLSTGEVSCSFLPWAHSFGQTCELHMFLSQGMSLGLAESTKTLLEDFLLLRPTVLIAVPRVFNRIYDGVTKKIEDQSALSRAMFYQGIKVAKKRRVMAEQGSKSFLLELQFGIFDRLVFSKVRERFGGRLSTIISGGAALSFEVGEFFDGIGLTVYEGYGLTETSPIVAVNYPAARRLGTVGKPLPGTKVFVCDEQQNVLPPMSDGEVVVVGPNVMQGYYGNAEATDAVIFELNGERAFRTGDMGRMSADGFLQITGRFKEQYKLENGKYVVPTPLEEQLKLSGFITQVFLYGDNRVFNVCLVIPDFPALEKWAKAESINYSSPTELVKHEKVHAKIGEELARYAAGFKGYEKPKRWCLLTEDFTTDNGLLTPKMSVRRRIVAERYRSVLEEMYS